MAYAIADIERARLSDERLAVRTPSCVWLSSRAFCVPAGGRACVVLMCHCVRHIDVDNKHGRSVKAIHSSRHVGRLARSSVPGCQHTEREPPRGKKSSMGSENRQIFRCNLNAEVRRDALNPSQAKACGSHPSLGLSVFFFLFRESAISPSRPHAPHRKRGFCHKIMLYSLGRFSLRTRTCVGRTSSEAATEWETPITVPATHGVSLGRLCQCARDSERLPVRSRRKVASRERSPPSGIRSPPCCEPVAVPCQEQEN